MSFDFNPWLLGYLTAINLITLMAFAMDKISSRTNAWRIRERTLLILAFLGGSLGALFAMHFFRHKTKKGSFLMMLGIILLIQLAIIFAFATNMTINFSSPY